MATMTGIALPRKNGMSLARGLGWFSIGLGVAEVVTPGGVARLIGVPQRRRALIRGLGFREIASGIGILIQGKPTVGLWSRVAGDVMDLSLLGKGLRSKKTDRTRLAAATAAVAGVTALDVFGSQRLTRSSGAGGAVHVEKSITINRSPEDLYGFWHNLENLPRFMTHIKSVRLTGEKHSHWVARAPVGTSVEWDAEIVDDRPNELIAWRSIPGADVDNSGSVRFEKAPQGRGTVIRVSLDYGPPAGAPGLSLAKLFGQAPEKQVPVELLRFKQLMETGGPE